MAYLSQSCDLTKVRLGVILVAYVSWSHDLPKKEILMDYISSLKIELPNKEILKAYITNLKIEFPKKEILMAYVSKSCD
jgi:hypothetical protein